MNNFSEHKLILENSNYFSKRINQKRIAIFLDRDGVIIKDMHYLSNPEEVKLELGIKNLMQFAFDNCIPVFVVTNQSGIARKKFSWDDYFNVTNRMLEIIGSPNPIVGIYSNCHIKAKNNNEYDSFGISVSISNKSIAVGAIGEDSNQTIIT